MVVALAAKDEQGKRGAGGIYHIIIGWRGEKAILIGTLSVQDEESVSASEQRDNKIVVAEAGVEGRDGANARAFMRPCHVDVVRSVATPDGDAIGEVPGGISLIGNVAKRESPHE